MDSNEETVQKRVVVNNPGQQSEVVTERTERRSPPSGLSTSTIVIIAIVVMIAIAAVFYVVINKNANESANRNANLEAATQGPPTTVVQQPAQQAPVIIQQPAPIQAPVIVQQPVPSSLRENTSANDDANMQNIATKKLTEDSDMAGVVMTITDARVVLTGSVNSEAIKAKAELIVKSVRGVKSVDNQIVVLV